MGWSSPLKPPTARLPLGLKVFLTAIVLIEFVLSVLPKGLGLQNWLWFCDVALVVGMVGAWLESSFLCSMAMVSIVGVQSVWILDYFVRLFTGSTFLGFTDYMFGRSPVVHAIQLYHVWFPFLIVWMVARLGYHRRAWLAQFVLAWVVLLVAHFVADPARNIDWSRYPGPALAPNPEAYLPSWLSSDVYFALLGLGLTVGVYLTTHWIALKVFKQPQFSRPMWNRADAEPGQREPKNQELNLARSIQPETVNGAS